MQRFHREQYFHRKRPTFSEEYLSPINLTLKNSIIKGNVLIENNYKEAFRERIQRWLETRKGVTFHNFSINVKIEDSEISGSVILERFKGSIGIYSHEKTKIGVIEIKNSQIGSFFIKNLDNKEKNKTEIKGYLLFNDTVIGEITDISPSIIIEGLVAEGIMITSSSKDERKQIKLGIRITNSKIRDLILKNVEVYEGDIYLKDNEISGIVNFPNTTIFDSVEFDECKFTGEFLGEE